MIPREGFALFVPSELQSGLDAGYNRNGDLATIQGFLEKKIVSQRLLDLGLSTEEAYARLKNLSDEQIHELATHVDDIKSGGDGLTVVVFLLVIVVLVIVILQLTGHKVIITK
ncbi:MAG: PA2779 family protein [Nitrospirae bacterium]|nr:PA2779 family protein [Nitrospirota bacterium]